MVIKKFVTETDKVPSRLLLKPINRSNTKDSMTVRSITNYDNFTESKTKRESSNNNKIKIEEDSYSSADKINMISQVVEKVGKHKSLKEMSTYRSVPGNLHKTHSYRSSEVTKFSKKGTKGNKKISKKDSSLLQICQRIPKFESISSKRIIRSKRSHPKKKQNISNPLRHYDLDYNWSSHDLDYDKVDNLPEVKKNVKSSTSNFTTNELKRQPDKNIEPHDIWSMLRKMNKFQFKATPVISQESIITAKKKVVSRKRNKKRKGSVVETCSSTEVAYISSIRVNTRSRKTITPSSSLDEVKVIDMNEFDEPFSPTNPRRHRLSFNKKIDQHELIGRKDSKRTNRTAVTKDVGVNHNANQKEMGDHVLRKQMQNKKIYTNNRYNGDVTVADRKEFTTADHSFRRLNKFQHMESINDGRMSFASNSGMTNEIRDSKAVNSLNTTRTSLLDSPRGADDTFAKTLDQTERRVGSATMQRKQRFVTTMPSTAIDVKITPKEIRQRIANIKFPFVISRKDQISSNFHVPNYEPPQFQGLEEHIWPFMIDWIESGKDICDKEIGKQWFPIRRKRLDSKQNELGNPLDNLVTKKSITESKVYPTKSESTRRYIKSNKEKVIKPVRKQKRYLQYDLERKRLEDRNEMIKLLFEKCSGLNSDFDKNEIKLQSKTNSQCKNINLASMDNSTETDHFHSVADVMSAEPKENKNHKNGYFEVPYSYTGPCNDPVENIIRKITDGVYCNENNKPVKYDKKTHGKTLCCSIDENVMESEILMQEEKQKEADEFTEIEMSYNDLIISPICEQSILMKIPGFDEPLPPLHLESVGLDQINVTHCGTNKTVQFNITVQHEPNSILGDISDQTLSYVPVSDVNPKVFKCKRVVFNAKLPTEICTILPNLMGGILREDQAEYETFNSSNVSSKQSTILKKSQLALVPFAKGSFATMFSTQKRKEVRSHSQLDEIFSLLRKQTIIHFMHKVRASTFFTSIAYTPSLIDWSSNSDFRTVPSMKINFMISNANVESTKSFINFKSRLPIKEISSDDKEPHLISKPWISNLQTDSKKMLCDFNSDLSNVVTGIIVKEELHTISVSILNDFNDRKSLINGVNINTKQNHVGQVFVNEVTASTADELVQEYDDNLKKCSVIKLYNSKSISSITIKKKNVKSLAEITRLEDFLEVLGLERTSKLLDKKHGERVLSSIVQLKLWESEISLNQALLILLLCNKKETSNMRKFGSTILQGIALNRITSLSELEMEAELIDNGHFQTSPEYEGFSYVPASDENRSKLLEEMYSVARIAASDYRIPFDDSYKTTLKSFISKQRKLNPRYLKVMARLTGLGLFKKTPGNCGLR